MNMQKLCLYAGKTKKISNNDIIQCLGRNETFISWSLFNAMDSRNLHECLVVFEKAKLLGESDKDTAISVLNNMMWRFELILLGKEMLRAGKTKEDAIASLLSFKRHKKQKDGKEETEAKPIYSEKMARNIIVGGAGHTPPVEMYSASDLYRIVGGIADCLVRLRESPDDADAILFVRTLFMSICGTYNSAILASLWRPING
jgi:hypothetical protein